MPSMEGRRGFRCSSITELGELARREARELEAEEPVDLAGLAAEFEDLFRDQGLWPTDKPGCSELAPAYR